MSRIREKLQNQSFSSTATYIIKASWRTGTQKQCESFFSKWKLYCCEKKINPFSLAVEEGINFLSRLYDDGIGYIVLNTVRCALSSIVFCKTIYFLETILQSGNLTRVYMKRDYNYQNIVIFCMLIQFCNF